MTQIPTALTALLSLLLVAGGPASAAGLRIVDGDTVVIGRETIRILNIDAPEKRRAGCDAERRLARVAARRLAELLGSGTVDIKRGDGKRMKGRYGRTLARLEVGGEDVGETLVAEGLARPWNGKRQPWCN